jgi:hypothetical protein
MNRNVKKSVASARSRRAIAIRTSVLVVTTGLDEVIFPPNRARLNCRKGSTVIIRSVHESDAAHAVSVALLEMRFVCPLATLL